MRRREGTVGGTAGGHVVRWALAALVASGASWGVTSAGGAVLGAQRCAGVERCVLGSRATPSMGQAIADAALQEMGRGLRYVSGGGEANGPTRGGFDGTGLVLYAIYQATGFDAFATRRGVTVRGTGFAQWVATRPGVRALPPWGTSASLPYPVNADGTYPALRSGDVLVFSHGARVGIYVGDGMVVQSGPQVGAPGDPWYFADGVGTYPLWYLSGKGQQLPATPGEYPITAVYRFSGSAGPAPADAPLRNRVLRVVATGTAYLVDGRGEIHRIPDPLSYKYYVAELGRPIDVSAARVATLGSGLPWALRQVRRVDAADHILVVPATQRWYLTDASGQVHWIPTASVFSCLVASGYGVVHNVAQSQIATLGSGLPWATCTLPPELSWITRHPSRQSR